MRTLFVMSVVFVVDVTRIGCRPWSAVRPGKARPHSRLVEPLKLRPVLSLLSSFRRKSNLHLMLLSQGDAIEAHILKPVHSQPSEKQLRFPTQHEFQHQWCHNPLKKTGSGYSDPALATMPLEYFESPARIFLRKVEAKGPNCFWRLDIRLTAIAYGCGNAIGQRPRALQAIKLP